MCMAVYLASDTPLPLVAWDKDNPAFNVVELQENEEAVKRQFSKSHIYYVGADTQCSCGFSEATGEGPEEALKSRREFAAYAANAVENGPLELFVCWEGDWTEEPEQRLILTPQDLVDSEEWHRELTFAIISKANT